MTVKFDWPYLCGTICRLSSVPVRVYEHGERTFFQSSLPLPTDPIRPHERRILAVEGGVGYLITEDFDFYGLVRDGDTAVVIGPSRQMPRTPAELRRLAFDLNVRDADIGQFVTSLGAVLPLPLDFLLEILCMLNYMIRGEKLGLGDLRVTDLEQTRLSRQATEEQVRQTLDDMPEKMPVDAWNAWQVEQEMLALVRSGDLPRLEEWFSGMQAVKGGQIAADTLRQQKNIFTVTTTLVSRAAVEGGMDVEDAMRLSDSYIRKCEQLSSLDNINNLQISMVRNYTEQVARIRACGPRTDLARKVTAYVRRHLSEPVRAEDIAGELHYGRSYLSTLFKKEQGVDLTSYIQQVKISEAEHLLLHTDRSLMTISSYLGYSSQSRFSRVFKAVTGMTPGEYRKQGPQKKDL